LLQAGAHHGSINEAQPRCVDEVMMMMVLVGVVMVVVVVVVMVVVVLVVMPFFWRLRR
jgi:heme/copper-type cytochrome/quinol oxidase subunit 2